MWEYNSVEEKKKRNTAETVSTKLGYTLWSVASKQSEGHILHWPPCIFTGEQFHFPICMLSGEHLLPNALLFSHQGLLLYRLLSVRKTLKMNPAENHWRAVIEEEESQRTLVKHNAFRDQQVSSTVSPQSESLLRSGPTAFWQAQKCRRSSLSDGLPRELGLEQKGLTWPGKKLSVQ